MASERLLTCLKLWRENQNEEALMLLLDDNIRLIGFIAQKYKGMGLSIDELMSIGKEGFLKAVSAYNYEENQINTFHSYVYLTIQRHILKEIKIMRANSKKEISFSTPIATSDEGESLTIEDIIGTDDFVDKLIDKIEFEKVKKCFPILSLNEKRVVFLKYLSFKTYTSSELSRKMKCSRQNVSQIEKRALDKLRIGVNIIF